MVRRLTYFFSLACILVGVALAKPVMAVPCDPTIDDCGIGTLDFTYDSFSPTADGYSFRLLTVNRVNFTVYSCLSTLFQCNTHPVTDSVYWKNLGGGIDDQLPKTYAMTGVRSNIKFPAISIRVSDPVSDPTPKTRSVELTNVTTLPSFTPSTSTTSNLRPTQATISWSTTYLGAPQVIYGLQPPLWADEGTILPITDEFTGIASAGPNEAWGVTYDGDIYHRTITGWQKKVIPNSALPFHFTAIDVIQKNFGWAVGGVGSSAPVVYRMIDGASWTQFSTPPVLFLTPTDVHAATTNTAWMSTTSGKIYFYNGSAWVDRTPSLTTGNPINKIFTTDDIHVIAVGAQGGMYITSNSGTIWTKVTLPTNPFTDLISLASVDGKTIWLGGRSGNLWKSTDSGSTWVTQNFLTIADHVWGLAMIDETHLWISQTGIVGLWDGSTYTGDQTIFQSTGNWPVGFAVMRSGDIVAGVGPKSFEYSLFGTIINGTASTTPAITLTGLSSSLPAGVKYQYAAVSTAGNIGGGTFGELNLPAPDAIKPTVSFTNPSAGTTTTRTASFTATGNAQDNAGVATIEVSVNGVSQVVTAAPDLSTGPASATWSSSFTLVQGPNNITVTAYDTSNNFVTLTRSLTLDAQAPTLSIASPLNGSTQNLTPIALNGLTADDTAVVNMDYQMNGGAVVTIPVPAGGGGNWSSTIPSPISGSNTVTVHAYDRAGNVATASSTFTYAAPTFTLSASPSTTQIGPIGQTFNYTITAASENNFSGAVTLSAVSAPAGLLTSFGTPTVNLVAGGNGTSTFTVTTDGLNPGNYSVTITGTSGTKTVTSPLSITLLTAPNFTLSAAANNPPADIIAGDGVSYTISAAANDTLTGVVTLSLSGQPTGVTPRFTPTSLSLTPNSTATGQLSITTTTATTPGAYSLVISGLVGSIRQETTVALNISAPPNFEVQMSPATQAVVAGSPATFYGGSIQSLNSFTGLVDLTAAVTGAPAGITTVLSRTSVQVPANGKGSFILNVQADHQVAGGTYVVTITGSSTIGGRTVSNVATVNLTVAEDTTAPTITSIQANPNYAEVTITWLTNEPTDGSITLYTDSALTTAVGTQGAGSACSTLPCAHSVNYRNLAQTPTTYYFTVTSRDIAPARNSTTVSQQAGAPLQFTTLPEPDSQPPVLDVTSPAASIVPTSIIGQVAITGTATDNQAMAQVVISIAAQTGSWTGITVPRTCSGLNCAFSYTWTTDQSVPNGIYTITVIATDAAGNAAPTIIRSVDVRNDFTKPQVLSGPTVVVSQTCTSASCTAILTWTTDDPSTSEVEYNTSIPYCPDVNNTSSCLIEVDDRANGNKASLQTSHQITLTNLEPNQIYHYRITSCNGNRVCTN